MFKESSIKSVAFAKAALRRRLQAQDRRKLESKEKDNELVKSL